MSDYPVLLTSLIIFVAFFVRSFTGFGAALISVPLLALFFDMKFVVPLELIFEIALGFMLAPRVFAEISFKHVGNLLVGLLLGNVVGAYLLVNVANDVLRLVLGVTVFVLTLYMLRIAQKPIEWNISARWGIIFGLLAGTLGGSFNMSGPMTVLYLSHQLADKTRFRATLIGLFLVTSVWKGALFVYNGLFSRQMLRVY